MKFKHLSILLTSMLITTSAFAQEYIATSSKISNIVVKPGDSGSGTETPPPVNTNNAVGFENDYAPSNWTLSGVAGTSFNQTGLTISVAGGGGGKNVDITVLNSGIITFDWSITVNSAGQYGDRISYAVNGVQTHLSTAGSASGSVSSVVVNAGDTFQFSTWGTTSSSSYSASITNFTFTE